MSEQSSETDLTSARNADPAPNEAGAGNVARPRWCDTRRRKGEPTGNTNFGLNRRASPRPPTSAEMIGVSRAYAAAASSVKNSENPCAPAVFAALFAGRISVEVAVDCLKLDAEDVAVSSA